MGNNLVLESIHNLPDPPYWKTDICKTPFSLVTDDQGSEDKETKQKYFWPTRREHICIISLFLFVSFFVNLIPENRYYVDLFCL